MPKTKIKSSSEVLVPITIKVPLRLLTAMDEAVENEDTDRSKFTRRAIKDRLQKFGFQTPTAA